MASIIQIRRDTLSNWNNADPILAQGEFGHVLNELDLRIGDGVTQFSGLVNILANPEQTLATANW